MKAYRYYLFDIDRTLWDFDTNADAALRRMIAAHPLLKPFSGQPEVFIACYERNNHRLWDEYEAGLLCKDDLRWRRFSDTLEEQGTPNEALGREMGERYLNEMIQGTALMPYARQVLEHLHQQGARIGALTNGFREVQYQKLERSGIRQYFDAVVISEEVGYLKPHPEIFRIALEQTAGISAADDPQAWKALKEETLMVGDDARNDIEGAQIFGIDQWFVKKYAASYGVGATYESDDLGLLFQ